MLVYSIILSANQGVQHTQNKLFPFVKGFVLLLRKLLLAGYGDYMIPSLLIKHMEIIKNIANNLHYKATDICKSIIVK